MNPLLPEQEQLLDQLCRATRSGKNHRRNPFIGAQTMGGTSITHEGLPNGKLDEVHWGDLGVLLRHGMLEGHEKRASMIFAVSAKGIRYWENVQRAQSAGGERIESTVKALLNAAWFVARYPEAGHRWSEAEALLAAANSEQDFTTIGHKCREAMIKFAEAVCDECGITPPGSPEKTVTRLSAALDERKNTLTGGRIELAKGTIDYWKVVSDFAQRQEHGAGKEGEVLTWDDSRACVFSTAFVMYELAMLFQ